MPLLSIITITKNNARAAALTGKSLSLQIDAPHYEWIVIDGDSNDNTAERVAEYLGTGDIFISEPDRNLYDAMNKGLDRATGDYVWFMNAGDAFADSFVMRDVAREIPASVRADILYADAREGAYIKKHKPPHTIQRGMVTHHQAIIYRRDAIGDLRYSEEYTIASDYLFTLYMFERARRIHDFDRILCDFAPHGVSQENAALGRAENFAIRRDYLKMPDWKNKLIRTKDTVSSTLKRNYPKLYWHFRAAKPIPAYNTIPVRSHNAVLRAHRKNLTSIDTNHKKP